MPVFDERNKEKIHHVLYDAVPAVPSDEEENGNGTFGFTRVLGSGNTLAFFLDVQRKTKLETNMEASGLLSRNSYEIRAMRVVIGPLPAGDAGGDSPPSPIDGGDGTISPRVIEEFIYNSVTTLRVGEKLYFEAPTFLLPSGAGIVGGNGNSAVGHGEPDPMATWRFAEPILVERQQLLRVEIVFPRGIRALTNLSEAMIRVWVILDGYLTRDVQ